MIKVSETEPAYVTSPTEVGTGDPEEDTAPLSEIIERLNDRFGTDFTDEDRLFFEQVKERAVRDEDVPPHGPRQHLRQVRPRLPPPAPANSWSSAWAENDAIVTRFLDEADFQEIVSEGLAREIFAAVAEPAGEPSA